MITAQSPPQDLDAESGVLGSIMLDNRVIEEVTAILDEDMFYSTANGSIYAAMLHMHSQGRPIDPVLLCEQLVSQKELANVGGAEYILKIVEAVPHSAHANYYSRIVRERAQQRRLIWKLKELTSELYEGMKPDVAVGELDRLSQSVGTGLVGETSVLLATAIDERDAWNQAVEQGLIQIIGTSLPGVDAAHELRGMPGGWFGIIAARTSVGKTMYGVQIAYDAAAAGVPAVIYSLEMRQRRVADRVLKYQARDLVRSRQLWVNDKLRDIRHIVMDIRMHVRKHGVRLVLLDYLQLIRPANPKLDRRFQMEEISRAIVELKNELDIVILGISQLNRGSEGQKPKLSDLSESGALENDADSVLLLHRLRDREEGCVIVAKNRDGTTGVEIDVKLNSQTARFEERDKFADLSEMR